MYPQLIIICDENETLLQLEFYCSNIPNVLLLGAFSSEEILTNQSAINDADIIIIDNELKIKLDHVFAVLPQSRKIIYVSADTTPADLKNKYHSIFSLKKPFTVSCLMEVTMQAVNAD